MDIAALIRATCEQRRDQYARQHSEYVEAGARAKAAEMRGQVTAMTEVLTGYDMDDATPS